ncbi:SDR family oxidoreductase [Flavobacterium sp.]|uniref:SDR family oxidoreductase n=1 Tax=Flavobacterium sp. TaxID=239 RepID=UPI0025C183A6|nr:SDR family oxidoreductase [Flavobacterium sp.]MBA4153499.1 oxidoreductase [Flavobacterium sp.]
MKKILITGCSSGFGFQAAKYLAEKGHHVYATMRNTNSSNKEAAENLKKYAAEKNLKIEVIDLDVTSDESVKAAMTKIPTVDVLINNAGRGFGGPLEAFSSAECLAQLDLNIVGNIRMAKAVLPGMRANKSGLIIQLSSIAGRLAVPGFGIYHASKWAVEGLSESLRYELGPLGIDVAIVQPGPFETSFFPNIIPGHDDEVANAYPHVNGFSEGFGSNVHSAFADENAPTDPMIVVKTFEKLIDTPAGKRPLRNVAGLDFGVLAINEAMEPFRINVLESFQITDWDGVKA